VVAASGTAWPEVVELRDGSVRYVADHPGDRTVIREIDRPEVYVAYGGRGFPIPHPDTLLRLGLSWVDVRVLPTGSIGRLPKVPRDGTLLKAESADAVYLVDGGELRWIPDPDTFAARGLRWDRIGVVADAALAELPVGAPLPRRQPDAWADRPSGHLTTWDHDRVDYRIEPARVAADTVEFVIALGDGLTWRKEIHLEAQDGQWTYGVQDAERTASNGLYRYQLPQGRLVLRKAKEFGAMRDVLVLAELDRLPEGSRVTFTWVRD
jgi:hypothetical protein